jgi:hypothetical protein
VRALGDAGLLLVREHQIARVDGSGTRSEARPTRRSWLHPMQRVGRRAGSAPRGAAALRRARAYAL